MHRSLQQTIEMGNCFFCWGAALVVQESADLHPGTTGFEVTPPNDWGGPRTSKCFSFNPCILLARIQVQLSDECSCQNCRLRECPTSMGTESSCDAVLLHSLIPSQLISRVCLDTYLKQKRDGNSHAAEFSDLACRLLATSRLGTTPAVCLRVQHPTPNTAWPPPTSSSSKRSPPNPSTIIDLHELQKAPSPSTKADADTPNKLSTKSCEIALQSTKPQHLPKVPQEPMNKRFDQITSIPSADADADADL